MNVVVSSAWLEYFANGPNADFFAPAIEGTNDLVVPSLTPHEVFKRILQQRDDTLALQPAAVMRQGRVVDQHARLALDAARISVLHQLPMADSVVLAIAGAYDATFWTQDANLQGVPGVRYRARGAKGGGG